MSDDLSAPETARGMMSILIKDMTSTAAGVIFFVLVARYLPDIEDLGFLTGLQTIILMFVILSGVGLPNSATRFISTYIGSGKNDRAMFLYPVIFLLCMITSIAFSFLLYYLSPFLSGLLFGGEEYASLLRVASVDIFLASMIYTFSFLLYASKRFAKVAVFSIINTVIKFSLAFIFLVNGSGLYGIIVGLIIGDTIALSLFIIALIPNILGRIKLSSVSALSELKSLFQFALPLYGTIILNFLSYRIDLYFLMALSTLYAVGIYSPAVFVSNAFLLFLVAIDQGLLPVTARIFGKNSLKDFRYICKSSSRYLFLFLFPLGIAIATSAPILIVNIMGERFADSTYPVIIMVIAITVTSPVVIFNNLLRSAGYTGTLLKNETVSISLEMIMLVTMIPMFGVIGAAGAKFISRMVYIVYPYFKLKKLGAIEFDRTALRNGLTGSLIIGILILFLSSITEEYHFFIPSIYIISLFGYLAFLRVTHALDKEDIEFLDKILMGRMKWFTAIVSKIVIN